MRILLVEDNQKLVRSMKKGLEAEKYAVDTAENGEDGAYHACINDYDVIILDVRLPGKDGYTVCREIRQRGRSTPILMLTSNDASYQKIEGLDSGADDYLTKPFDFDELLARLRALIRRKSARLDPNLIIGNLHLNPVTHEVSRGGKNIKLTSTEYRILKYFMEAKGQVLEQEIRARDENARQMDLEINRVKEEMDERVRGYEEKEQELLEI